MSLTLSQRLDLFPAILSLSATFVWAVLTIVSRSPQYPKSWLLHIGYALFRKSTSRLSTAQLQYVLPTSDKVYNRCIRSTRQAPITVVLPHGALGHWVGDPRAKNVLIWFHGGGFALPSNVGYIKFWSSLVADAERNQQSLAVFALTYTLSPGCTYPTQLRQAVEALRHIVLSRKHSPANIILGGDSAGGNLVCGVLSHLAHPHPAIDPLPLSEDLAGAVMIAPWTNLDPNLAQQQEGETDSRGDLITPAVARPWSLAYLGGKERDYYTDLSMAPAEWFRAFPLRKALVCGGGSEILLPVIEDFVEKFRAGFPAVEFFIGEGEGHVAPVYNLHIGDRTETEQGKQVKVFLRNLLEKT